MRFISLFESGVPQKFKRSPIKLVYDGEPIVGTMPARKVKDANGNISFDREPTHLVKGDEGTILVRTNAVGLDKPLMYFERASDRAWFSVDSLKKFKKI